MTNVLNPKRRIRPTIPVKIGPKISSQSAIRHPGPQRQTPSLSRLAPGTGPSNRAANTQLGWARPSVPTDPAARARALAPEQPPLHPSLVPGWFSFDFRPEPAPETLLDRRGMPRTSTCAKNQPRRTFLRPARGERNIIRVGGQAGHPPGVQVETCKTLRGTRFKFRSRGHP